MSLNGGDDVIAPVSSVPGGHAHIVPHLVGVEWRDAEREWFIWRGAAWAS
jgi:hypothetical protein